MQQKMIPRTSKLLLEVTSYRDGILNRMPKFEKELGRGQFGVVYSTESEWVNRPEGTKIAIKATGLEQPVLTMTLQMSFFLGNISLDIITVVIIVTLVVVVFISALSFSFHCRCHSVVVFIFQARLSWMSLLF